MIVFDPDWKDDAACIGMPIEVFFPKLSVGRNAERRNAPLFSEAIATCARCPVRADCLADAMRHERGRPKKERWGFFGGTTPDQRMAIRERATA